VQAFRLGDSVWGVQFHPEVTRPILEEWFSGSPDEHPGDRDEMLASYDQRAGEWEAFGRTLCGKFVEAAERVAVTA
jgi:GMP synthase (glutamine-hydrolysing)